MKVEVYLDKRKMGKSKSRVYSIRQCTGGQKKVIYKSSSIMLENVEFVVQNSGRQSTVEKLKAGSSGIVAKNVHAFLRGRLVFRGRNALKAMKEKNANINNSAWNPVGYSPLLTETWKILNGSYSINHEKNIDKNPIALNANTAFLHADGIIVN